VLSARLLGLCSLVCLLVDVTVPWYQSLFLYVVRAQCTGLTLSFWPLRAIMFISSRGTDRLATCATYCAYEIFALLEPTGMALHPSCPHDLAPMRQHVLFAVQYWPLSHMTFALRSRQVWPLCATFRVPMIWPLGAIMIR